MNPIKRIIADAVRAEVQAALDKQTAGIVAVLNAYTARLQQAEAVIDKQTQVLAMLAEGMTGLTGAVFDTRDSILGDSTEADCWKR